MKQAADTFIFEGEYSDEKIIKQRQTPSLFIPLFSSSPLPFFALSQFSSHYIGRAGIEEEGCSWRECGPALG
jgi:hypothetical protein